MPGHHPELTAVADSIALNGPGVGVLDLAQHALDFYTIRYSDYPPRVLASEVARCRSLLIDHSTVSTDMRRVVGWLSALLGNLAHHTGDAPGAFVHLGAASRAGVRVGEPRLTGWALGAQSMAAMAQDRPAEALELAEQAAEYADTPLRRAQTTAWCRLRPLAALGDWGRLDESVAASQLHMDAADREEGGRFGFDRAEFHLHLGEALLGRDPAAAGRHAETSAGLKRAGSPGWAAATAVLARAHAAARDSRSATVLGVGVLESVPSGALRATTRGRLRQLATDLHGQPGAEDLRAALRDEG
ncbi:hypothetical protein [Nocardiopsis ansamitocini]|uniref:Uncharacterized protein n=1 Tax=Nocardiopsis ansamitocini TaxID=1670832 RepID=A0A9W6UHM8_9ACTN|nr:hypothetical protein [Nocardiopsis ansamitocini]GLU49036.1 hypothetical protein Nans01_33870 [Nocardiopsis ansamitocini]